MTDQLDNSIDIENRYLTFTIGEITYGISIENVLEIIGVGKFTKVPGLPEYVVGLTNMRGKVVPVVDFRLKLKKSLRKYDDRTCVIVTSKDNTVVGFLVDKAESVMEIKEEDIASVPEGKLGDEAPFLRGLGRKDGDIQLLIDIEKLI